MSQLYFSPHYTAYLVLILMDNWKVTGNKWWLRGWMQLTSFVLPPDINNVTGEVSVGRCLGKSQDLISAAWCAGVVRGDDLSSLMTHIKWTFTLRLVSLASKPPPLLYPLSIIHPITSSFSPFNPCQGGRRHPPSPYQLGSQCSSSSWSAVSWQWHTISVKTSVGK